MKESVMQGQALFAVRKKAGDADRYLGAKILSGEEKSPSLPKVRGFVPIYAAAKYLADLSAAHGAIDHDTATPRQNKVVEDALEDMLDKSIVRHPEALGWYKGDIEETMKILEAVAPEIQKPDHRFRATLSIAITSDGNRPVDNIRLGHDGYKNWADNGEFVTRLTGRRDNSIKRAFALVNALSPNFADDMAFQKWLLEDKPVGEIARELSGMLDIPYKEATKLLNGENVDEVLPRALILGPKRGAFFCNLSGRYDQLTMDQWKMRTMGRIQGHLYDEPTHDQIEDRREKLRVALDNAPKSQKILEIEPGLFGPIWTGQDLDEIAKKIKKLSTREDIRDSLSDIEGGDDVRTAGNSRADQMDGELIDAPTSGSHRTWIRERDKAVQKRMADKGRPIEMSDLQAALWIGEKEIYDEFGTKPVKGYYLSDGAKALHEKLLGRPFGGDAAAAGDVGERGGAGAGQDSLFAIRKKSKEELGKTFAITKTLQSVMDNPQGFTIDMRTGEPATSGYAVAPSKLTENILDQDPTEDDIVDFVNRFLPVFEADPQAMLGGWKRDDKKHVQDVSYLKPNTDAGRDEARRRRAGPDDP